MRILVLEDEPLIAMMLADWLAELGQEVVGPLATATEALQAIEAGVDAALIDLQLRHGDSSAVAYRLRADGVPFAIASGGATEGLAPFRNCPMLSKPFEFESVDDLVRGWKGTAGPPCSEGP